MTEPSEASSPWTPRGARDLAVSTVKEIPADRIPGLAAEVAFFALLSLPPTLLAVFGALGPIARAIGPRATTRIQEQLLSGASTFLTADAVQTLSEVIDALLEQGGGAAVIVGIVVALWSASRATKVFMEAVNIAYDLPEVRRGWHRRLVAAAITLLGVLAVLIVLPLLVLGPRFGRLIGAGELVATIWAWVYWPTVAVLGVALLASFYHYAPYWTTPWRRDLPGAVFAAIGWVAGSFALRVYVNLTIQSNSAYAPLASPIVLLLWMYVTAFALLMGAELNAQLEKLWPTTGYVRALMDAEET